MWEVDEALVKCKKSTKSPRPKPVDWITLGHILIENQVKDGTLILEDSRSYLAINSKIKKNAAEKLFGQHTHQTSEN